MTSESSKTNAASDFSVITASDVTSTEGVRALYVSATGTLQVQNRKGVTVNFGTVEVGILPIQPSKVMATGTTATVIGLR